MIQDIYPSRLSNEFINCEIKDNDILLAFDRDGKILVGDKDGEICFLHGSEARNSDAIYLFSVDETRYFLLRQDSDFIKEGFE